MINHLCLCKENSECRFKTISECCTILNSTTFMNKDGSKRPCPFRKEYDHKYDELKSYVINHKK